MPKIFITFCTAILIALSFANAQGYVMSSLFNGGEKADKTANRYHK